MQRFRKTTCLSIKWGENEKQEEEGQHYFYNGKLVTSLEVQTMPFKALPLPRTSSHPLCAQSRLHHWIPSGSESGAACRSRWVVPQSALETQADEEASLQERKLLPTSSNLTETSVFWQLPSPSRWLPISLKYYRNPHLSGIWLSKVHLCVEY